MKTNLIYLFTGLVFFTACSNNPNSSNNDKTTSAIDSAKIIHKNDSIKTAKRITDSTDIANIKENKVVNVSDKTVTVLSKAQLTDKLKFEFGESTHQEKLAERDKAFLNIKIKLSSKSKLNGRGGDFFPNLNVFSITNNTTKYLGEMTYQLYKTDDIGVTYLEQIFDYKESENFVCSLDVNKPLTQKIIISVNVNKNKTFDKNTVIAVIDK
jgi:uncharacterized protein YcfL